MYTCINILTSFAYGLPGRLLKLETPDQIKDSLFTYILNLRVLSGRRNPKSYLSTFTTHKTRLQLKQIYNMLISTTTEL